jgi:acylaminoacyl-peptidase
VPKRPIVAEDLSRMAFLGDPQVRPDGGAVLFAEKRAGPKNKYLTHLLLVDARTKAVRQLTFGEQSAGSGRWSPDGSQIAFVSGREESTAQIYLLPMDGGEGRRLTSLPEGDIGAIRWSPDGRHIALAFREAHPARTKAAQKAREEQGLSEPPWEIEDLYYRLDGDGYFGPQRFRPYVVDVQTGTHRALDGGDPLGQFSFDWLPDSSGLVLARSANPDPLLQRPNDQLYLVPLKGKARRIPCDTKGSKSSPSLSPDGAWIAYLGSDHQDDPWGVHNTRLWILPTQGGKARCLTPDDDYCLDVLSLSDTSFGFVADGGGSGLVLWKPDSTTVYVNVGHHGAVHLAKVPVKPGGATLLTKPRQAVVGTNRSRNGLVACTVGTATRLAEVALFDPGKGVVTRLTDQNRGFHQEVELVEPTEHWVKSTDGVRVHTWCLVPKGRAKRKPAVLEIHGGPHAQYGWAFFHEFQLLAANGYLVVYSNPRGSKGYGDAHCAAIRGNWGEKDWQDVQAVTAWMKQRPDVDPKRMGVMGGSYGGYMTNWAVSHTDEFRAAITDRCVFNWLSAAGNSDFPLNKDGYFGGQAWGDHAEIKTLWEQGPIAHFGNVKTPMLIIHSAGDLRCNVEQGEQVFYVLKSLGVPTRFVRYPASTSHGMSRNGPLDLRVHRLNEILAWWKRWLA